MLLRPASFAALLCALGFSMPALAGSPSATTTAETTPTTNQTSSAILNGTGTPNGQDASGSFMYSTTNPGTCNGTFGTAVPSTGGTDLGSGSIAVGYSYTVTGLTSGITYYYCAIVTNASGTAYGNIVSFVVPGSPTGTTTSPATLVSSTGATLNGSANPTGNSTTGVFRYSTTNPVTCNTTFGTQVGSASLGSGTSSVAYSDALTGLLPGATYYYCAIATNTYGTGLGSPLSFTTLAIAPTVTTNGATSVAGTSAALNGTSNPGGADTTGSFLFSTTNGTCNASFGTPVPTTGGTDLGSGNSAVGFSQSVTRLSDGTTYYYCAVATNLIGTTYGSVVSFTTLQPPTVTTVETESLTNTSVTLIGDVNPNGDTTSAWFEYGLTNPGTCNGTFGSSAPTGGGLSEGSGSTTLQFSQSITDLSPSTTYYWCALASNPEGQSIGLVQSFTTLGPPTVTSSAATAITSSTATLNGSGNPEGASTTAWFRYSATNPGACTNSFGAEVPSSGTLSLGSTAGAVPFSEGITGLTPNTTYYFCAIDNNAYGTVLGSLLSFTTSAALPIVSTSGVSSVTGTGATFLGSANPGGADTMGWFRYATASPGTCNNTFGTAVPASDDPDLGSETVSVSYQQSVTGLTPNTTYYYCALASNSVGQAVGSVLNFTTPLPPVVTTAAAVSIMNTTAYLEGTANPENATTAGWFLYSTTTAANCSASFGTQIPASPGINLGTGTNVESYNTQVTGLTPGMTYYYCAVAQNSEGTVYGSIVSFTTDAPPVVTTQAATSVTYNSATLNGSGTPKGADTTGWFLYSLTNQSSCSSFSGTRVPSSGGYDLSTGSAPVNYSYSITGLSPVTTYYYCAVASNAYGTAYGSTVQSFTTAAATPVTQTLTSSSTDGVTATLNGETDPEGADTTGWFLYSTVNQSSCSSFSGTRVPATSGTDLGSETSYVSFSQTISGLTPQVTYYFCALSSSTVGSSVGSVLSFITPIAPTVTTTAAASITNVGAFLEATANPNDASTTGWFRYSATNPTSCNNTFGSVAPTTPVSLESGGSAVGYSASITGLSSGATYYYCAIAENSVGTSFGTVLSFTTATTPVLTTHAASSVAATTATLNGTGVPDGADTTAWFMYSTVNPGTCSNSFGTRVPSSGSTDLGSGSAGVNYSYQATGLAPNVTYYYCAIGTNTYGTTWGSPGSFTTTAAVPLVTTNSVSSLTGTTATLNGTGTPEGADTTAWFRYATVSPGSCNNTFGTQAPTTPTDLGSGDSSVGFSQTISGLTSGSTYYYCAIVQNSVSIAYGSVVSFTTPVPPTVTTLYASSITNTTAYLYGTANPNNGTTTGWFEYSGTQPSNCSTTFGTTVPTSGYAVGSGTTAVTYDAEVSGLTANTTYYFCAFATNAAGTTLGSVVSFTTASAPVITTDAATSVTATGAVLNGSGNPDEATTTAYFIYSAVSAATCSSLPGSETAGTNLGAGATAVAYSETLSGLLPGTTYYFCAYGSNSYGTSYGSVLSFTTLAALPTVTTQAVTNATGTSVTLNGTGVPEGADTTGSFRYATSNPGTCNTTFGTPVPATGGTDLGAGDSAVSFSQSLTGLTAGMTYYYCAIVSNSVGTGVGSVVLFTTPLTPVVTTNSAVSITNTTAYLEGAANPENSSTTGWFRYATTAPTSCNSTFGSAAPTSGGASLGAGSASTGYSFQITGLSPATTYWYCAIAQNSQGIGYGTVLSFTTLAPPTVTTDAATSIVATSAVLNGSGVPNGADTTAWFEYSTVFPGTCSTSFGSRVPTSGGTDLSTGTAPVNFSNTITGLVPSTTYYYCAITQNTYGTALGAILSFETAAAIPTVSTSGASSLTGTTATLNGSADPGGADATAWFRYSTASPGTCNDSFGTRAPATAGTDLGSGNSSVGFSQNISGLTPGITYYFCALSQNSVGLGVGSVVTLATPLPPAMTTVAATPITATTATLNGYGAGNGYTTTGFFEYSTTNPGTCSSSFGTTVPTTTGENVGSTGASYSYALTGLTPGTEYFFCAFGTSSVGTGYGTILNFTTSSAAPTVNTVPASSIASGTATLNGSAVPNGDDTTAWFEYSTTNPGTCTASFGTQVPATPTDLGSGTSTATWSQTLTSLSNGTTYYFCAIATNAIGTSYGAVLSFNTSAPLVTTSAATSVTSTGATLNGAANPNGASTSGWFRYSTTNPVTCSDSFGTRAPTTGGTSLGSGTSSASYTQAITALSPGTTYYFCAIASNSAGTAEGAVLSFTTAGPPAVSTTAAALVTTTGATLNGSATPNGGDTTGSFLYGTTNPGTCTASYGTPAGGTDIGAGTSAAPFSQALTGLTPDTTYYACAVATNAYGTVYGSVISFTTSAAAPSVSTVSSSVTSATTVTLNGSAIPDGSATTGYFEYSETNPGTCDSSFGTTAPMSGVSLGAGTTAQSFSTTLTGLTEGMTYYFCAFAANGIGPGYGAVMIFTTPTAPVVTTEAAETVTNATAILDAQVNPTGLDTSVWFRYDTTSPTSCNDTFGTRTPATGGEDIGSGTVAANINMEISGLSPLTTYYYCAIASSSAGVSVGSVVSFTTAGAPVVTAGGSKSLKSTSVTLTGSANPDGADTVGSFLYGTTNPGTCSAGFGTPLPATGGTDLGSSTITAPFSNALTGLTPDTTYYACAVATSVDGTVYGSVFSFTTPAAAPTVSTVSGTPVSGASVTLDGSGIPNGADTTAFFEYGTTNPGTCDSTFGTAVPAGGVELGSGTSAQTFSETVTGLTPGTTYYFCAFATNSVGTSYGAVMSVATLQPPAVTTLAATALTNNTTTLQGSANPDGASSSGWFRYDTTNPGACNGTFGTQVPTAASFPLGSGNLPVPFSQALTNLTPDTTYYYCALAQNAAGEVYGSVLSFTTYGPPSVTTDPVASITSTSAKLKGAATPDGADTTAWFVYSTTNPGTCSTTFGTSVPASGGTDLGSGTSAVSFSETASGLTPGATYYVCAVASNSFGTGLGSVVTFSTPAAAPAVTTVSALPQSGTTAQLNGSANPDGADTSAWFRYDTSNPGTCNNTFGTRIPATGGADLGAGSSTITFSENLSGLTAGTTYYACAIASSTEGTVFGNVISFMEPLGPAVVTSAATALSSTGATLNGTVNPDGASTTAWFRYDTTNPGTCNNAFGTQVPTAPGLSVGTGTTGTPFSEPLTGLTPGETYYFCAIASNAAGLSTGSVLSFTTPLAPDATTVAATLVTGTTATLNGTVNPNGTDTTGWFRYSSTNPGSCNDTFGTQIPVTPTDLGSGATAANLTQAVTGLNSGTTYYFCAIAESTGGTSLGQLLQFTTLSGPVVTTEAATVVSTDSATLNGSADPNGLSSTGWFRYSPTNPGTCDDTFGTRAPATGGASLGAGTIATPWSQNITGLSVAVTYYYCAIASNSIGTSFGAVMSFTTTTPNVPPAVTTEVATDLSGTGATVNATANPEFNATTGWFRFSPTEPSSCNDTFGTRVPATGGTSLGTGGTPAAYAETLTGLAPGTTYYFCAIASNVLGTGYGSVLSFTTGNAPPSVTTHMATGVSGEQATLNGSANPNGADTTGWFRYDTTNPTSCNDTFGTRAPDSGGTDVGSGTTAASFDQSVTGLTPGTKYYFCAIASSSAGKSFGSVLSFTPGAVAPTVTTTAATGVSGTGATLAGTANPNGLESTGWFQYGMTQPSTCDSSFGLRAPATGGTDIPAGTSAVPFTQALTGLNPLSTYYYCAAASNEGGASFGAVMSFSTPAAAPVVLTNMPSAGAGVATLAGAANPGGADTTAWFRYATTNPGTCDDMFGTRVPAAGGVDLGSGMIATPFSESVTGLAAGTYYVCALATNSTGSGVGMPVQFTVTAASGSTGSGCKCGTGDPTSLLWLIPLLLLVVPRRMWRRARGLKPTPHTQGGTWLVESPSFQFRSS